MHTFVYLLLCPRCFSSALYKYGHNKLGKQKYLCRQCKHQFTAAKHSPKASETFIKIKGIIYYLWILLDSETRLVISFILSDKWDSTSAYRLFQRTVSLTRASPKAIITDHLAAYAQAIATFYPNAERYCYKDFTDDRSNNTIEAFNKTFKAWYRPKKGLKAFTSSLGLITTYIFHYNFLRQHTSLNQLPPAVVAGASYSDNRRQQWLIS